jgi:hypothetical protein
LILLIVVAAAVVAAAVAMAIAGHCTTPLVAHLLSYFCRRALQLGILLIPRHWIHGPPRR